MNAIKPHVIKKKSLFIVYKITGILATLLLPLFTISQGANMSNPIIMGTYGTGSYTYNDSRNTSSYGNDHGQTSADIFYSFTVNSTTTIDISTCGTAWDTYLWLLDANGNEIVRNDDNGTTCAGIAASIVIPSAQTVITTLAAGTYYIVAEGYANSTGIVNLSVNLTVQAAVTYNTRNFIRTWIATAPETDPNTLMTKVLNDVKQLTTYLDGLGRPEQIVMKKGSLSTTGNTDMVSATVYDAFGREGLKYLPYVSPSNDGLYKTNVLTEQNAFYSGSSSPVYGQGENYFYGKTDFEPSPLNRVAKTYMPGASWVGNNIGEETKYWINTTTDAVRVWTVVDVTNDYGTYGSSSTYLPGQLYKHLSVDEQGKQVIEFKDKEGKVILKKVQLTASPDDGITGSGHTGWLCTYHIYDDFGMLRAVIQPKAVDAMNNTSSWTPDPTSLNELVFRYEYDARGRTIMKKVPGAGTVYMIYDARDRLIMMQDANMKDIQKWMVTVYENNFNRPISTYLINDPSNYNNAEYHRSQAAASVAYPLVSNFTNELLTENHYDDYNNLPAGLAATLYNSGYSTYLTASTSSPEYGEAIIQASSAKGMVTWTKVKVLGTVNQYNSSVNIYDDKGRIIQVQSTNISGGLDIVTNQYSFSGEVLRSHTKHQKQGGSPQTYHLATKYNYDELNRLSSTEKNINNTGWRTISSLAYDAIGHLKSKKLAPSYNSGAGIETLNHDYNIHGWLLGINRNYLTTQGQSGTIRFGFELGYDKVASSTGRNFQGSGLLNGNITGMTWKSDGDDVRRKYDFSYDAANRLLQGVYEQDDAINSWNSTTMKYTMQMGNGTDPNQAYDANGNIKAMTQYGWKLGSPASIIDNLVYAYNTNSNKLQAVNDIITAENKLGDFTDKNTTATDYGYDKNGNLITDLNKRINGSTGIDLSSGGAISYNYLNLPVQFNVKKDDGTAKGSITYTYDAAGNKLKKEVNEIGLPAKTTLYLFGIYENDVLQFLPQEEGRIRLRSSDNSFQYDYFINDHLGNIRMVLTEEQKTDMYPAATMEAPSATTEETFYSNLPATRVNPPSGYPANTPQGNAKVAKVNGGGNKIGPAIILKVMAGDRFTLNVNSWWSGSSPGSPQNPLNDLISALSSNIAGASGGKATITELTNSGVSSAAANSFLGSQSSYDNTKPKAFVNWMCLDEQFKFYNSSSGFEQVGNSNAYSTHTRANLTIDKSGYLYIYVSNETANIDVFFDNLQVTHTRGPLIEETHYYPFGLIMAGISGKAMNFGSPQNRFKFNGGNELQSNEFSDGSGLEMLDAVHRMYDPQIGRFWQIDELAEVNWEESLYSFSHNNPLLFNDPLGLTPSDTAENNGKVKELQEVTVYNIPKTYWGRMNLYYKIQDYLASRKANYTQLVQPSLWKMMDEMDQAYRFRNNVAARTWKQDEITLEVAMWVVPAGKLLKWKYLKYLGRLFRWKRGKAVIKATGEVTEQVVKHGDEAAKGGAYVTENLAGFYVRGSTSIANGTYTRTIQSLANTGNRSLFDLMKVFEAEARAAGVNKVVINGIDIVETRLINEGGARLLGYTFKQTSVNSIQLTKILK